MDIFSSLIFPINHTSFLSPVGEASPQHRFGTKLLVFGFLYNMRDHCDAVQVLDVQDVVNSTWFQDAVDGYAAHVEP